MADTKDNAGANTQAAVDTERARIKAIDDMTLPGFEDLANKAKYEEPVTAEAFAMQIITEQKKTGQAFLNDRQEDVDNSGVKMLPRLPTTADREKTTTHSARLSTRCIHRQNNRR